MQPTKWTKTETSQTANNVRGNIWKKGINDREIAKIAKIAYTNVRSLNSSIQRDMFSSLSIQAR